MLVLYISLIALGLFCFSLIFTFFRLLEVLLPIIFRGAIYVPTKEKRIQKMIDFLEIRPGEKAVDLGAGDGRLVVALAKAGAEAYGYEINPFLVSRARKNIRKAGLEGRAFIHQKNFWKEDLSQFDVVTLYGITHIMKKLEDKLRKELKPNARVASNAFNFPTWEYSKKEGAVYLYLNNF